MYKVLFNSKNGCLNKNNINDKENNTLKTFISK